MEPSVGPIARTMARCSIARTTTQRHISVMSTGRRVRYARQVEAGGHGPEEARDKDHGGSRVEWLPQLEQRDRAGHVRLQRTRRAEAPVDDDPPPARLQQEVSRVEVAVAEPVATAEPHQRFLGERRQVWRDLYVPDPLPRALVHRRQAIGSREHVQAGVDPACHPRLAWHQPGLATHQVEQVLPVDALHDRALAPREAHRFPGAGCGDASRQCGGDADPLRLDASVPILPEEAQGRAPPPRRIISAS